MPKASLAKIVKYCDTLLRTHAISDYDGAVNGLQVENSGRVTRIAAAVDGSLATVRMAVAARADLLIVHHGLFWSRMQPWTESRYTLMRLLIESDLAVYSSHLPLDLHPKLGNNALLGAALGLRPLRTFLEIRGQKVGYESRAKISRALLSSRLAEALGSKPKLLPSGPATCRRIGIVTGGAGSELTEAAAAGVDTFITGEGPHWTFAKAEELGLNVFYGGHYATETFGVKALAAHLAREFRLPWTFVDHPSKL